MKYSENFNVVSQSLGYTSAPKTIKSASGGCIHDSSVWEYGDGEKFFVKFAKTSEKQQMLKAELVALTSIRQTNTIKVPEPILGESIPGEEFVLVLEYLDLVPLQSNSAIKLGEHLAELHQHKKSQYGFDSDNFIGATPQSNRWSKKWAEFFWSERLLPQLNLATNRGYHLGHLGSVEVSVAKLLEDYQPQGALLHGDLWGGNAAALPDGTPVVYDPASYYGDAETDLAFTEVFGGFPAQFYEAYESNVERDDIKGVLRRKKLYNLYHYLNHLNLFGSSYLSSCLAILNDL